MTLRRALPLCLSFFLMLSLIAVAQRNRDERATAPQASSDQSAKSPADGKAGEAKAESRRKRCRSLRPS